MLSIKQALAKIAESLPAILGEDIQDIRLEEMETSAMNGKYILTISFLRPYERGKENSPGMAVFTPPFTRVYKDVTINPDSGEIEAIKIHKDV